MKHDFCDWRCPGLSCFHPFFGTNALGHHHLATTMLLNSDFETLSLFGRLNGLDGALGKVSRCFRHGAQVLYATGNATTSATRKTQHARMQLQETLWRHCAALFSKHGRFVETPNKVDRPVWSFRRMAGCGSTFESRKLWKWTQPHLQRIHVKMECPQNRLQETQHAVDLMWVCFARGTNESGRCVIICCRRKWANEDFGSMHSG